MLKIQDQFSQSSTKTTPNLLPCQIYHDGPVNNPSQYWKPSAKEDGTNEVYLRGRKLQGKEVKLPTGYEGIIVQDGGVQKKHAKDLMYVDDDEDEEEEEVGSLEQTGGFDRVMIWDHEKIVEDDDAFVKGMTEWIGFAEAIHKPGEKSEFTKS